MMEIQESELIGDWFLTGGEVCAEVRLDRNGNYRLEQLGTGPQDFGTPLAGHSGRWTTVSSQKENPAPSERWLALTVEKSDDRHPGNWFAWPKEPAGTPAMVMLLVEKLAPEVFAARDLHDNQVFTAVMTPDKKHAALAHVPPLADDFAALKAKLDRLSVPAEVVGHGADPLEALRSELNDFCAKVAATGDPALLAQADKLKKQLALKETELDIARRVEELKAKEAELENARRLNDLNAEKSRLDQQRALLDAQKTLLASRASVQQAEAAKEAQIQKIQLQTKLDDAQAEAERNALVAGFNTWSFTQSQNLYALQRAAQDDAHKLFMRTSFGRWG